MTSVVALVPAYNEAHKIGRVIDECKQYCDKVFVCDDGSTDGTYRVSAEHGASVARHQTNQGYGAALQTLFRLASDSHFQGSQFDVAVVIDGDGQHDPREIPSLVREIDNGFDVAAGVRTDASDVPRVRKLGMRVLDRVSGTEVGDSQCGFRAYRTSILNQIIPTEMGMGAGAQILRLATEHKLKICEVPVTVSYGEDTSTHNPVVHGSDVLLNSLKLATTRRPLSYFCLPGLGWLAIAAFFWGWDLDNYALYKTIDVGLAVVAAAFTFIGFSFISLGILIWILTSVVRESHRAR